MKLVRRRICTRTRATYNWYELYISIEKFVNSNVDAINQIAHIYLTIQTFFFFFFSPIQYGFDEYGKTWIHPHKKTKLLRVRSNRKKKMTIENCNEYLTAIDLIWFSFFYYDFALYLIHLYVKYTNTICEQK